MSNFALIGAAGYVAPRHMKAIKETGNELVAALNPCDSVGILDSHFPDADFFVEFERFDRHIDLLKRTGKPIDYVSICSPNYLHDSHIRFALRNGAHAICEKPLVLNPWNLDALLALEQESDTNIYTILQLRLHPTTIALKNMVDNAPADQQFDVELTYVASRGSWYHVSWKGDQLKSGGVATNIGIHFFDMLSYVFGPVLDLELHFSDKDTMAGYLNFANARVKWILSIDAGNLPQEAIAKGKTTYRNISVNGHEQDFSDGFTDLHTESYRQILAGRGYGIEETRACVDTVSQLRNIPPVLNEANAHPLLLQRQGSGNTRVSSRALRSNVRQNSTWSEYG